ncbi:hypothetical protein FIBSPDRAFT_903817 [Athelia psychrophila]|uniref:Uncharacterized protein n=1 Tax=Athelia psychrophila TaxID=1759441 RepID=A0A167VHL1_9AGAM|nr:hypothetical protein FIBSPDRAFT_903817 [Fibularhizoctonia sp. CBS 109695]
MPTILPPVLEPVTFSFDSDEVQLISIVDAAIGTTIKLGTRGAGNHIMDHRGHDNCKRKMLRDAKKAAKLQNLVWSKQEERALGILEQITTGWRRQKNIPDSDGFDLTHPHSHGPGGSPCLGLHWDWISNSYNSKPGKMAEWSKAPD